GAGRTSDGNGSHASTLKSPSYTKSVSWQHYRRFVDRGSVFIIGKRLRWARDYSSFGIREDENWRLVFLIFITPRFFLPPGKSVMWLRLDAARHVTGWFETIF
ncbi:hypothetical protein PU646_22100, partial [Klebsiella pneumoniae]|uniref:hypothetical protein n=2 Tax=Klebsiella pneumoniae TaxID=573 RepID=UPI0038D06B67